MQQISHVSGNINGAAFTGEATGTYDAATHVSQTHIDFTGFPLNYTPLLCRSCHLVEPDGDENYIAAAGGNYDLDETVDYIAGAAGQVHTTASVRAVSPSSAEAFSTFNGTYQGPTDVASIPEHRETFTPIDRGLLHITGYRKVMLVSGGSVETNWYGTLSVILPPDAPWNPYSFRIDYQWQSWNWQPGQPFSQLDKTFTLAATKQMMGSINPATAQDVPAVKALYDGWQSRYLSAQGIDPASVPVWEEATFHQLLSSASHLLLVASVNNNLAGFALASVETAPDDFLLPPYGDFLFLLVEPAYYGFGIESRLYMGVMDWLKQQNVKALRTTVAAGDIVQQTLWRSLKTVPVAERLHRALG